MTDIKFKEENGAITIILSGRVDTNNAAETEEKINSYLEGKTIESLVMDCTSLSYISSSGLRIILRLKKKCDKTTLKNVNQDVYSILETTGFTEMMEVQKASKTVSIKGCELIGHGSNGKVYRLDPETIVKVYKNPDALPEIYRERELARTAFVLGIPTAISYDVVQIEGGGYGSVFELLNAKSFTSLITDKEKTVDEVVKMSVDLVKQIHSTDVSPDSMPSMKEIAVDWATFLKDHIDKEHYDKLIKMVKAVPESKKMMHGDYHVKNILYQDGEALLIDMDTICYGNPIFEFASMFNAYKGFESGKEGAVKEFIGLDLDVCAEIWDKSLRMYFGTDDKEKLAEIEAKASVVGYARLLRRAIRRLGPDTPEGKTQIANFEACLIQALDRIESLEI
jgi:uncharacterized protein (TIGR02172 family)